MTRNRLEAFSDGVIAILITIMILELKVPHGADQEALRPLVAPFLGYVLSFIFLGIYWNNHHHMLHATPRVNGSMLWANLHLLFWLSLVPVTTGWLGEHHRDPLPAAAYGTVLLFSAVAYTILQATIIREAGPDSLLARAVRRDVKGKVSLALYCVGIGLAWVDPLFSELLYATTAVIWLVPDRRIERLASARPDTAGG